MIIYNAHDYGYKLYKTNYFSNKYNHQIYFKYTNDAGQDKIYISICTTIRNKEILQGYIYANVDKLSKTSEFIGMKVDYHFRNQNIGSLLVSLWIDFCYNNGYDFLKTTNKQRKPFLLYLLKKYGFEVYDTNLYETRNDVISICQNPDSNDKLLLFKDPKHEKVFRTSKAFKNDNYQITDSQEDLILLDKIIMPLQNASKNPINYELLNQQLASEKTSLVLKRHQK